MNFRVIKKDGLLLDDSNTLTSVYIHKGLVMVIGCYKGSSASSSLGHSILS